MNKHLRFYLTLAGFFLAFALSAYQVTFAKDTALVTVQACRQDLPDGKTKYSYKLINNSGQEIVIMTIGWDGSVNPELLEPDLLVPPVGWDFDAGLPADASTSPAGWYATVITQEESDYHYLQWEIDYRFSPGLSSGRTLQGFSVILPKPDDRYLNSHFDVIFRNGKRLRYSTTLEKVNCDMIYDSRAEK